MEIKRHLPPWLTVVTISVSILFFAFFAYAVKNEKYCSQNTPQKADAIFINTLKSFGPLEREEVPFLHDAHTDALDKQNKDCSTCHLSTEFSGEKILSLKFKRLEDKSRKQVMEVYHSECIFCHKEMNDTGAKSGPIELCGECHIKDPLYTSSAQIPDFNKFMHFIHTDSLKDPGTGKTDCSTCHHEYDSKTGKAGSCRYCHKTETEENPISMKQASHLSCIPCHKEKLADNTKSGPIKCGECHDPLEQMKINKPQNIPRLNSNQPDFVLISSAPQTQKETAGINPVPFNHMSHEQHQDTCRICHHAELDSCSRSCHTTRGSEKGGMITAEQAMHRTGSKQSCLGCHNAVKKEKACAGCHSTIESSADNKSMCIKCHMTPTDTDAVKNMDSEAVAEMMIESGKPVLETYSDKDIPETVTIKEISSQYGPVEMPHRFIITSLMNGIKDSKLAGTFHDTGTLCQGCHHNSPASKIPPRCISCHSAPFDENNPLKPGLKAAFHQQCMDCHAEMGIEAPLSTSCTECHAVAGKNKLQDF